MSAGRKDQNPRGPVRRAADAHGARRAGRAFRPLRWAWFLLLVALLAPTYDLFFPAGYSPTRQRRTVVIERGQTLHEIARELQRVGIIRSQVGFLVLARTMRLDRSVKAGQYSFRIGITVPSLLRALDRGMYGLNLVTIPEGLMVMETARLIERQVGIPAMSLDSLARDPELLDSLEIGAPSLEGWLAPDSYEWLPGTSPEVILRTMVARTRERVQRATAGYDSLPLGMNAHEVLTLASIVEAESRAREERPRIARVYLNRLDRGMLLQADPTVGYALGRGPRSRLTFKDLRVESPYNTYRHEGLPPGPICSPGAAAIEAVMNATPGVKDLYFVARGEGRHMFAPTYEQHLANIAYVRGKMAAAAHADDDDVVGADVDSTLPRPLGTTKPPLGQAPRAPVAPAAGTGAAPLKGNLLLPRATIHTAGSEALTPTLVKPAAGDSAKPRPKLSAGAAEPSTTKPAARPAGSDTARSRSRAGAVKAAGTTGSPSGAATTPKKPAPTTATKPAGTTAAAGKPANTTTGSPSNPKPTATTTGTRPPATAKTAAKTVARTAAKPAGSTATAKPPTASATKTASTPAKKPAKRDTTKSTKKTP